MLGEGTWSITYIPAACHTVLLKQVRVLPVKFVL
jgi:hypothetical protein